MSNETTGVWAALKSVGAAIRAWWGSDALSSRSVRVPFKLALVGLAAVVVLAFASYGAGKVAAYMGDAKPATAVQLSEFRSQIIAACAPPAAVSAPTKKSTTRK